MGEATFQENYKDDALGMFLFTKTKKLGRATKFGFRNKTRNGDENRIFGTPSIRDDIGKPKQISVACTYVSGFNLKKKQNYGNEPSAVELLFPHGYSHYGLTEEDLSILRNREEVIFFQIKKQIRDIYASIGVEYKGGKFEGIWLRAVELENNGEDNAVSVRTFLQAVKEMDHM